MSEPQPRNNRQVTLDDADLETRNAALRIENDTLKEELLVLDQRQMDLAKRVGVLYGVQTIGVLKPEQVRAVR